jgi:diacylglycerol O-acyltransferase
MERMTGMDAGFLYMETPTIHMHTIKASIIDPATVPGGYTFERFREVLGERLHLLPPFRRRVVEVPFGLTHPVWIDDPDFDIDRHIRRVVLDAPAGRAEMDRAIAVVASTPLPRDRPLWEIVVLEGMPNGHIGFVAKLHHALADGVAAAELLANVMDLEPDPPDPPVDPTGGTDWKGERVPSRRHLLWAAITDIFSAIGRLPALLGRTSRSVLAVGRRRREADVSPPLPVLHTPNVSFSTSLTPRRSFATTTLSLDDLRAVKSAAGVTINDVLLTLVAGALRDYLVVRDELPEAPLVAGVPVSTDRPDEMRRLGGNKVSNLFTALPTNEADPLARLDAVHEVTVAAKEVHNLLGVDMLADWVEYTPPRPYAWFMRQYSRFHLADHHRPPINVVVSNVPGPRDPLYIAGARLESIYSVGPVLEGIGLNVTAWSYLDQVHVSAIACRDVIPDLPEIITGMERALVDLQTALSDADGRLVPRVRPEAAPA